LVKVFFETGHDAQDLVNRPACLGFIGANQNALAECETVRLQGTLARQRSRETPAPANQREPANACSAGTMQLDQARLLDLLAQELPPSPRLR